MHLGCQGFDSPLFHRALRLKSWPSPGRPADLLPRIDGTMSERGNRSLTIVAVFAGSLATALATGRFHLEGYQSPRHMLRSAGGAALMGAGGVMAFGCSIGQGLTGLSTLSLASFVAVAGILAGTAVGLRGALRVRPLAAA